MLSITWWYWSFPLPSTRSASTAGSSASWTIFTPVTTFRRTSVGFSFLRATFPFYRRRASYPWRWSTSTARSSAPWTISTPITTFRLTSMGFSFLRAAFPFYRYRASFPWRWSAPTSRPSAMLGFASSSTPRFLCSRSWPIWTISWRAVRIPRRWSSHIKLRTFRPSPVPSTNWSTSIIPSATKLEDKQLRRKNQESKMLTQQESV